MKRGICAGFVFAAIVGSALLFAIAIHAATPSPCGATPVPGQPHVCLVWTASPTATGYNVFRSATSGAENYSTPLNVAPTANTFFNDTTDLTGTTYFYTVIALGPGGATSLPSAEVQAQVPVPPAAPGSPGASID